MITGGGWFRPLLRMTPLQALAAAPCSSVRFLRIPSGIPAGVDRIPWGCLLAAVVQ